jgi:membrane protein DedA with SNARE-associated domain
VNYSLITLVNFPTHDLWWLAQFITLLMLPFAHEDLAILFGAYVVVNEYMPAGFVALCIYGGMVASDFALYAIGAGVRRLPCLRRLTVSERVRSFAGTLQLNLFGMMALCRVVPGVAFVVLMSCGWARVPLARFAVASFAVSALYLPLMLYLVIEFGGRLDGRVGWWAWPTLVAALAAVDFVRRRVFALQDRPAEARAMDAKTRQGHGRSAPGLAAYRQRLGLAAHARAGWSGRRVRWRALRRLASF